MPPWLGRCASAASAMVDRVAAPRLSILIFHRVLAQPDALFPDEIDATRFAILVRTVQRNWRVLPLGAAAALLQQNRLPPRALAITFDDGYADNAEIALPILQRAGLPATFFVATGFLDGGRMFNDTVIECLRATSLERVDLGDFGLGVRVLGSAAARRAVIEELLPRVKYLGLAEREPFLERLLRQCGQPKLPHDLMMRSEQVVQLHRAGMAIGAHTVRHPILRLLPDDEARAEIARGRTTLEDLIGARVELFAYPNGRPGEDYDARHVEMVRGLEFRAAVSTSPGSAVAGADPYQLPRFTPWDRDPVRWAARLAHHRVRRRGAAVIA